MRRRGQSLALRRASQRRRPIGCEGRTVIIDDGIRHAISVSGIVVRKLLTSASRRADDPALRWWRDRSARPALLDAIADSMPDIRKSMPPSDYNFAYKSFVTPCRINFRLPNERFTVQPGLP